MKRDIIKYQFERENSNFTLGSFGFNVSTMKHLITKKQFSLSDAKAPIESIKLLQTYGKPSLHFFGGDDCLIHHGESSTGKLAVHFDTVFGVGSRPYHYLKGPRLDGLRLGFMNNCDASKGIWCVRDDHFVGRVPNRSRDSTAVLVW